MRYEGFVAAMKSAGVTVDPSLVQGGLFTYRSALEATEKLLDRKRPPTAIFASNDDMAAAAISVAHRQGLDVPRDLSVVGFDDTASATTVWPELTTVRQPVAAMAATAIELLERSIRRRKEGEPRIVIDHIVPHLLVKRDSVSSPAIT
jgi:LacI family transcriptional regulator